jgi:HEAT repeat protein
VPPARAQKSLDSALAAVRAARELDEDGAHGALLKGLEHRSWLVVAEAAAAAQELGLTDLIGPLARVWECFSRDGTKTDPGCRAKLAALDALDHLEAMDPDYFLPAVDYRQMEPVYGGRADTAGGARVRALFALHRMSHPDAVLLTGKLLGDPEAPVRSGSAQALSNYGSRESASLLILKLRVGDEDPMVLVECCAALMNLAPEVGLPVMAEHLRGDEDQLCEAAALALGQSPRVEAAACLIEWVEAHRYAPRLQLGLRALGLSRLEPARCYLLEQIANGSQSVAESALFALGTHHYDEGLRTRAAAAVAKNSRARLGAVLERAFGARSEA